MRSISRLSFPSNLLLRISIIAIIGSSNAKITTKGTRKNKLKIPILYRILVFIKLQLLLLSRVCDCLFSLYLFYQTILNVYNRIGFISHRSFVCYNYGGKSVGIQITQNLHHFHSRHTIQGTGWFISQ